MNQNIQDFIESATIAVVGVSTSRKKFGNSVYRGLKEKGYNVFPVNPFAEAVEGERCFPDLTSIPEPVEAAIILTKPKNSEGIVEDARNKGIKKIWFQQGADFSKQVEKAQKAGMAVVSKKCIFMYAPPVKGGHALHRFFAKLFGKL